MVDKYRPFLDRPMVAHGANEFGAAPALVTESEVLTYTDLDSLVRRAVSGLTEQGVVPGGIVGILARSDVDMIVLTCALFEMGAVAAPLPTRYPAAQLARMCHDMGASIVIESQDAGPATVAHEGLTTISMRLVMDGPADEGAPKKESLDPDRIALVVQTSGSGAAPKAAALTYANLVFSALGSNKNIRLGPGDRWLICLPLYHVGGVGILFRCFLSGACVAVPTDPRQIGASIRELEATHVSLVPTQLRRLLMMENLDAATATLKCVLVGGSALGSELASSAVKAGLPLVATYGLTEMASQVATSADVGAWSPSSGAVLPFRGVRIADGEILVRGETLFRGYVRKGGLDRPVNDQGWFRTGDRGYFDSACELVVTGRSDDMFISGGENVNPSEIEAVADEIDGIERSVAVGVADEEFGSRPVLFVRFQDGGAKQEAILSHLAAYLPPFKVPVAVFELPQDADLTLEKIDRHRLRGIAYNLLQESNLSRSSPNR